MKRWRKPINQAQYLKYKEKSRRFIYERIDYYNQFYNFKINRISVRNQRTRWGSCSGKGNLNFNYRILLLPQYLADYIIVHELCHLKEMNHSFKFWNLVVQVFPNYLEINKELRNKRIIL
ncbi:M48 family metallopeptidase [Patescibacteria group bacterium]|nr:M48 family metallopeptidase [Patescibacteria group bacterium]